MGSAPLCRTPCAAVVRRRGLRRARRGDHSAVVLQRAAGVLQLHLPAAKRGGAAVRGQGLFPERIAVRLFAGAAVRPAAVQPCGSCGAMAGAQIAIPAERADERLSGLYRRVVAGDFWLGAGVESRLSQASAAFLGLRLTAWQFFHFQPFLDVPYDLRLHRPLRHHRRVCALRPEHRRSGRAGTLVPFCHAVDQRTRLIPDGLSVFRNPGTHQPQP